MIYNILIIEEKQDSIKKDDIVFATTREKIVEQLTHNDIYVVVINPSICSVDSLETIFKELSIDLSSIFIFVIGDYDSELVDRSSLLIYDFIDISHTSLFYNKLKLCENIYKKELEHKQNIQRLLYTDNLTKLPNRTKLIEDLKNDNLSINALAIFDINSFKEINDFFGHRIGDMVLKGVADIIQKNISELEHKVLFYKFSADVYCLANCKLEHEDFKALVVKIVNILDETIFKEEHHEIDARVTAGITFSPKNNKLITADIALQVAKKENKNYLVFYDELDNLSEYQNNMKWTKKLKQALDKDNIVVYYQPLINNETMQVDKYECLVRMIDEDKVISPFFFLEVSKKANQYRNITKIVIDKAFREFENLSFEFSVNVSYEDIEDGQLLEYIKEKLQQYNVADRVVWEILEDESIKNYDVLLNFIKEVKALGCQIAIDDFGSGYSNFEHLLKMNVDYLKIDASLIKHVATDENSYKVVKTIVEFAKNLNLKTIAEFVENEEIFKITKELGATYSQGYYFSAPIYSPCLEKF